MFEAPTMFGYGDGAIERTIRDGEPIGDGPCDVHDGDAFNAIAVSMAVAVEVMDPFQRKFYTPLSCVQLALTPRDSL